MSVERLTFEPGRMSYHWMLATEHVVRYAFAASLCQGRRVLDVACGEGYGSYLLARAGAAAVVGVDLSAEAILAAEARFAAPGVRYLVGDAANLGALLTSEPPFDAVVSYETIEHVSDVDRFLDGIRTVLAPNGVVIISAPNEPGPIGHCSANPFHRRTLTFEQFRTLTERHLGQARRWYFGTPLQGMVITDAGSPLLLNDRADLSLMLDVEQSGAVLVPAQRDFLVAEAGCAFFVGLWGADSDPVIAGSPASLPGLLEPWKALESFRAENARLLREVQAPRDLERPGADMQTRMLADAVADLRRAALLDRARIETAEAALRKAADSEAALRARLEVAEAALLKATDSEGALRAEVARRTVDARALGARLQEIESSHGWRFVQAYARLLARPVAGWPLRQVRRALGRG